MKAQIELITIILEKDEGIVLRDELQLLLDRGKKSHEKFPMAHELKWILKKEVEKWD